MYTTKKQTAREYLAERKLGDKIDGKKVRNLKNKSSPVVICKEDYANLIIVFMTFGYSYNKIRALTEKIERWLDRYPDMDMLELANSLYQGHTLPKKNAFGLNFEITKPFKIDSSYKKDRDTFSEEWKTNKIK